MNDCKASGNELFHRLLTASAFLGDHLRNSSPCAIEPLSVRLSCNVGVLWPNGWMDQGTTLYGGRPQLRPHYVRWGLGIQLPPKRGTAPPQFSAHIYCGQTSGWMKMPLGMEASLDPGDIVLNADPASPIGGTAAPTF